MIKMKSKKPVSKVKNALGAICLSSQRNKRQKSDIRLSDTIMTQVPCSNTDRRCYTCSGCCKPIKKDKFLLKACDRYWHENCLKCDRCFSRLGELGSTMFCRENMNLCRQDYLEMFGKTGLCSACDKTISSSEMVMRAKQNVYHLECFACQICTQRFCVGDRFYLCENKVVCQYDYEENILPIQRSLLNPAKAELYHPNPGNIVFLDTNEHSNLNNEIANHHTTKSDPKPLHQLEESTLQTERPSSSYGFNQSLLSKEVISDDSSNATAQSIKLADEHFQLDGSETVT